MKVLTVFALVCAMMSLIEVAEGRCSNGWTQIESRCFRYIPYAMSWARAEKNCESLGGTLASIHSTSQYHQIQWLIRRDTHGDQKVWVGGSDAQQTHHWLWSDGSHFGYSRWCSGEPNNAWGSQHCLQINHSSSKCWDDVQCWSKRPSVCVKRLY